VLMSESVSMFICDNYGDPVSFDVFFSNLIVQVPRASSNRCYSTSLFDCWDVVGIGIDVVSGSASATFATQIRYGVREYSTVVSKYTDYSTVLLKNKNVRTANRTVQGSRTTVQYRVQYDTVKP
jgi:hypothetical protein